MPKHLMQANQTGWTFSNISVQLVRQAVDRRFNRARYDADLTVAAFAARPKDTVDLHSVRDNLGHRRRPGLAPAHVSVCILITFARVT